MKTLRALCLDLDDTLWPVGPVIAAAEQAMYEWLSVNCPAITASYDMEGMRAVRIATADRHPDKRHDLTFLRKAALSWHAEQAGYPQSVVDPAFEVFWKMRNTVQVFPDVEPALRRLRTRYRLLSLSNGNADLRVIGLADHFEHCFGARELGSAKPDPRVFAAMLERTALDPHEVAYVGDDPRADIEGARGAGLHAIWVDRFSRRWPAELEPPTQRVRDLTELANLLL